MKSRLEAFVFCLLLDLTVDVEQAVCYTACIIAFTFKGRCLLKALAVRGDTATTNGAMASGVMANGAMTSGVIQTMSLEVEQALTQLQGLAQSRGYLLFDDILAIWPQAEEQIEALEDLFARVQELGIEIYPDAGTAQAEIGPPPDGAGIEEIETTQLLEVGIDLDLSEMPTDDPLTLYLREMGRVPLLTPEHEMALAKQLAEGRVARRRLRNGGQWETDRLLELSRQGEAAREHLIRANTRLVVSVAKRYMGQGVPFADLIQEGNLGLMRAVERFDPAKGNRLSTYAMWWIRQSIIRAVANLSRTIRVPIHAGERERKLRKVAQELQQTLGRTPTAHELAAELGLTPRQVQRLQNMGQQAVSLDQPIREGESDGSSLADLIEDENSLAPSELAAQRLLRDDVAAVLADLKPREAEVLRLRYGLDGERVHTLKEVGELMGVTRERVRQLEMRALRKLRHPRIGRRLKGYQRRR